MRKAVSILVKKASSSRSKKTGTKSRAGSNRSDVPRSGRQREKHNRGVRRRRLRNLVQKRVRAKRYGREIKSSEVYQRSYQEGFHQGYAKGYEDGHQLAYANQV